MMQFKIFSLRKGLGINMKKSFLLAISLITALTVTTTFSGISPVAAAGTSSLSILERVETSDNNGLIRYKYLDENGNEVTPDTNSNKKDSTRKASPLPKTYDSREHGYVTPIKDQGVTGSCWAFAAIKSLESDSIIQNLSTLSDTDYSESHLVWYSASHLSDTSDPLYGDYVSRNETDTSSYYTVGGNAYIAGFILANGWGAVNESKAPFSGNTTQNLKEMVSSMSQKPDSLRTEADIHLKNVNFYDEKNTDEIKNAIIEHGSMDVSLYYNTSNMYHDASVSSAYETSHTSSDANHCVTIVGWDDDFNTFSTKAPGNGAWLIANSYGSDYKYNNNGYYWVSYYDTSLCDFCTFEADSADSYDTNFQYDGIGWDDMYYGKEDVRFSNIFTNNTDSPKEISAAGLYTYGTGQSYKIQVYRNITGSLPTSGTLINECTTTGTIDQAGYHTVSLATTAAIAAGEKFSIVVTYYSKNNSTVYVPIEGENRPFSSLSHFTSKSGQSFIYDNGKWMDNTAYISGSNDFFKTQKNNNNICLKALANTITSEEYNNTIDSYSSPAPDTADSPDPEVSTAAPVISSGPASVKTPAPSGQIPGTTNSPAPLTTDSSTSSGSSAAPDTTQTVTKTETCFVTLNKTKLILGKGESIKLPIKVTPSSAYRQLTYQSANKKIAYVNKKGIIRTKKTGKTTITIKTKQGLKVKIKLTVKKAPGKIRILSKKHILKKGQTKKLSIRLSAKSASYKKSFHSSNKKVISVSSSGLLKAKKRGKAKITVTTFNHKKASIVIRVK